MKVFKGFNPDLTCRGFQYKEGETFETPRASLCNEGFHACENPLDCFGYYAPGESVYHECELEGVSNERNDDSKVVGTKIKVGAKLDLSAMTKFAVDLIFSKIDWSNKKNSNDKSLSTATNTGDRSAATNTGISSAATNTGYKSAATNTGDYSAATNTGDYSAATNTGDYSAAMNIGIYSASEVGGTHSVAAALGKYCKAKASLGSAIFLVERGDWDGNGYPIIAVKSFIVDGKKYKPDTWYKLENKKVVEC